MCQTKNRPLACSLFGARERTCPRPAGPQQQLWKQVFKCWLPCEVPNGTSHLSVRVLCSWANLKSPWWGFLNWCARKDLNLHTLRHMLLRHACLPFHHSRLSFVSILLNALICELPLGSSFLRHACLSPLATPKLRYRKQVFIGRFPCEVLTSTSHFPPLARIKC